LLRKSSAQKASTTSHAAGDDVSVTTASTPARANLARRRWVPLSIAALVVLSSIVFALWTTATLGYSYSKGDRAGYMQKLSDKGWICKTWEGELAMQNLPGTPPEIFHFSVRDKAVASRIQDLEGQKVVLVYEQHKGVPTSCFGESEYFVTDVKKVGQ
jgi:hypothetical protein